MLCVVLAKLKCRWLSDSTDLLKFLGRARMSKGKSRQDDERQGMWAGSIFRGKENPSMRRGGHTALLFFLSPKLPFTDDLGQVAEEKLFVSR